jgi:WD40 repeat protein
VDTPARWFIGAATTKYQPETGLEDRPELAAEVERMAALFESLGYARVPRFGTGLGVGEFTDRLRRFLTDQASRRADDVVVVYYTGHGVLDQDRLLLPMADTDADVTFTALAAADLTGRLLRGSGRVKVVAQRMLFLLDTCYSGAAGAAMTSGAIEFVNRLRGLASNPSVAIVVAARPNEQAASCAFSRAFADAVGHRASGGYEPEFLALDGLVGLVNEQTPQWQHARLFLTGDSVTPFVPNPRLDRWLRDLDLRTQARQLLQAARATDQRDHVLPRARGLDSADSGAADLWLFTGRYAALAEACRWLRSRDGPATLVVTGDPGSGKSALLARLVVLADQKLRGRVPRLYTLPEATLPDPGSIASFIHVRGLTAEELMARLCEACGVEETTSPGRLLAALSGRTDPIVVIVDAVDEAGLRAEQASGQIPAVDLVLAPLIQAAGRTRLRLMLGTRRPQLQPLGGPVAVLDLDRGEYADLASVRRYVESCLVELSEESPYRHQPRAYLQDVAQAVAAAAGSSFLVALITARSLALTPRLVDPHDQAWHRGLPKLAADAMRTDLDQRLEGEAGRARDLLLPLAYARGSGLPWEDLWPTLARTLSGRRYTNDDLDWLIANVGYYITESSSQDGRRSTYRLYHEALAEHLRADREDPVADETAIVDALTEHTPRLPDGQCDWSQAHPYATTSLASHAAGTPRLDALVTDPRFLLAADPTQLLAALPAATTWPARAAGDAFRRVASRLRASSPDDRAAYLQLAARCARAAALADAVTASGLPLSYATEWASWRLQPAHVTLRGHAAPVKAVAFGQVDGQPVIISGSDDWTVRRWDAPTGAAIGDPLTGHTGGVRAVAFGQLDGRPVIISGSDDSTVRMWDATTGSASGDPLTGHTGGVLAVASEQVDGRPVIISGGGDRTVRMWDAATGAPVGSAPLTGLTSAVRAAAFGQVDGRPVIITGSHDGITRIWDAATGAPVGGPLIGHRGWVEGVAYGQADGQPVIVSGGDWTVRIWDAATGTPVGDPLGGDVGNVRAVAYGQADGRAVVISGQSNGTIRIWDAATGTLIGQPLTGHSHEAWTVALGHVDGRPVIVSGGDDGTVRIWDAAVAGLTGHPFTGHTGWVRAVAFGRPDGRPVIISGGDDGAVRIWDAATGILTRPPLTGFVAAVSTVAVGYLEGRVVIVAGGDIGTIRIWDAATGAPVGRSLEYFGDLFAVACAQVDGRLVIISGWHDHTVRIWDAATGTPVGDPLTGHTSRVNAVAAAELDGRPVIVSGSSDQTVRIWDATTGTPIGPPLTGHAGYVTAVAYAEVEGRPVIVSGSSDETVRIWDATTRTPIGPPLAGHTSGVTTVATGQLDGRPVIVSGSSDETVRIWDAATGTPIGPPLTGYAGSVSAVAFGQVDGHPVIISGGSQETLQAWDANTGTLIGEPFTGHTADVRAVTAGQVDGRPVVISASDDDTIRIWDAATGTPVGQYSSGRDAFIEAVAAGQVGGRPVIISSGARRTVRIWDAATGTPIGQPLAGHTASEVHAVAFGMVDGRPVIISGGEDQTVRRWDAATGKPIGDPLTGHASSVNAVAFGQVKDRSVIISGSSDATVRIWDAVTGAPVGSPLAGHTDWIQAVAIGQVGGRPVITAGGEDRTVRMWDAATGAPIGSRLTGHTSRVNAVMFGHAHGRSVIISGSHDGTVRIWDAAAGAPAATGLSRIDLAAPVNGLAATGPGRLVAATELGLVGLRWPG